jgi:CHASE3 domain sensor protein
VHVVQTGVSDAVVVALSVLANGMISEIKDLCTSKTETSINERIKRLIDAVLREFKSTFKRGTSFSILDIAIETLSQIFKTFFNQLKVLWRAARNTSKSIFDAIHSYIKGEINTKQQLISHIIKALFGASMVINTLALENTLHANLSVIFTPVISAFLSPVLAIFVGSAATVILGRQVDNALNIFFTTFANKNLAKERYERISAIYNEYLPKMVDQIDELQELIDKSYKDRQKTMSESFENFIQGVNQKNSDEITEALIKINKLYGKELCFKTQKEFDDFMDSDATFTL